MMPLATPDTRGSVGALGTPGVYSQYMHLPPEAPSRYMAWGLSFTGRFR